MRPDAGKFLREAGAHEQRFDFCQDGCTFADDSGVACDLARHGEEDAVDFGLLVFEQPHQIVVQLNGFERFEIDGLAAGASAVNDALYATLDLALDGNDEALATYGDQVVLGAAAFGQTPQCGAQAVFNGALLPFHLAADAPQLGRSIVGERAIG